MNIKFDMKNASRNFNAAVDQMAKLTGINREQIIRAEAGSVLKKSMEQTKGPPSVAKMTTAGRLRALKALKLTGGGLVSITAGTRGTTFGRVFLRKKDGSGYRRTHDGNFHPLNQHYTDAEWAAIKVAINDAKITIKKVVPEVKATRGLARQSWILIADSLGIRLETVPGGSLGAGAISSYREARARQNRQARNGASKVTIEAGKFAITLINRLPYGAKLGFQGILDAAVAGRAKFMMTALARGFAGSVNEMKALFPGWTISNASTS